MPEFRRGLGRFLPREAERDLYHPSLEDLRAEHAPGLRLRVATVLLWLDCWRVWATESRLFRAGARQGRTEVRPYMSEVRDMTEVRPDMTDVRLVRDPSHPPEITAMLMQDLRRALRLFRLEPGFAAAAVLTLALGIGANTALFAVVEAVLLRPLPVTDADRLVVITYHQTTTGITKEFLGLGDLIDMKQRQQTLEQLAPYGTFQGTLYGDAEPMRVEGLGATPEVFAALRVTPALGRIFNADDVREKAPPVVMIGHELWQTRFGSDPNIVSRSIQLGNQRPMVVGVLPRGFRFPANAITQMVAPLKLPATPPAQRQSGWVPAFGRLRDGQTIESARAEFLSLSSEFERLYPNQNQGLQYRVESLRDAMIGDTKRPLLLLLASVGFVLLIACVNVGNLLLARSLGRRQEMAVRTALGASRGRLATQVLLEGLVLAVAGGAVGVMLAWQLAPALATLIPETSRVPALQDVGLNVPVMFFSVAASILAALLFGGIACLSLSSGEQRSALAVTRGTSMSGGARRAASGLVVAEIALAGVLLVGAGLTLRSFANLIAVDPGFRTSGVLSVQLALPAARYPSPQARAELYSRAFAALEALPEIAHAGVAQVTPLTGNNWTVPLERVDRPSPAGVKPPDVGWQTSTGGFFRALDIPLREGRVFEDRDAAAPIAPVIISESIANAYFPDGSPVGRRLKSGDSEVEIIGVVGDIRRAALSDRPREDMYFPFARFADSQTTLFVQTTGDPLLVLPAVRTALRSLEPNIVVHRARTMEEIASASTAVTQLAMRLLGGFAGVALTLAAIGIYAVMAYSVRRRTRELGTRVALGASRADIIRLVMREGGTIAVIGVVIGLAAGLLAARSLTAVLFGVPPSDPWSIATAGAVLAFTAMAACYVPARRASRVDPARTLTD